MRFLLLSIVLLLAGCGKMAPPRAVTEAELGDTYKKALADLQKLNAEARQFRAADQYNEASDRITQGMQSAKILLAVRKPSLDAMLAVSDRDQIWAEMLMENKHYGHARQMWATEAARWKSWSPASPESEARLKRAQEAMAECDKKMFTK